MSQLQQHRAFLDNAKSQYNNIVLYFGVSESLILDSPSLHIVCIPLHCRQYLSSLHVMVYSMAAIIFSVMSFYRVISFRWHYIHLMMTSSQRATANIDKANSDYDQYSATLLYMHAFFAQVKSWERRHTHTSCSTSLGSLMLISTLHHWLNTLESGDNGATVFLQNSN